MKYSSMYSDAPLLALSMKFLAKSAMKLFLVVMKFYRSCKSKSMERYKNHLRLSSVLLSLFCRLIGCMRSRIQLKYGATLTK